MLCYNIASLYLHLSGLLEDWRGESGLKVARERISMREVMHVREFPDHRFYLLVRIRTFLRFFRFKSIWISEDYEELIVKYDYLIRTGSKPSQLAIIGCSGRSGLQITAKYAGASS